MEISLHQHIVVEVSKKNSISYISKFSLAIISIIGLFGLLISALLITVVAQKLILTREEKYIHTFVLNIELEKKRKHQVANVIKFSIKLWYLYRKKRENYLQYIFIQRKLYQSINQLKTIKNKQKKLIDHCLGLHELMTIQRNINVNNDKTNDKIIEIEKKLLNIEEKLDNIIQLNRLLFDHINKRE